jgi:hypothetical protein
MSEHLRVVFDIVTRNVSYRFAPMERAPAGLLIPPGLARLPASVVCSRPEGMRVSNDDGATMGLVPEVDLDLSRPDLIGEPPAPESTPSLAYP